MEGHRSPLPFVIHLDLEAQDIAELTLERLKVGVGRLYGTAGAGTSEVGVGASARLFAPRTRLSLADRIALGDDLPGQFFGIVSVGDRPRMTHADIAFQ